MALSADQEKLVIRKITQWLTIDKRLVTFAEVSREAQCHVNVAKNVLLSYVKAHPSYYITYLISGPLLSDASLAQTKLEAELDQKELARIAASQRVKIVDMDEVSDGERNSDDGLDDDEENGMDVDDLMGNDKGVGASDGIGGIGDGVRVENDEVVTPEETARWGVVLVGQDNFEEKRALFDPEGMQIHIYALSPGAVKDPGQYLIPTVQLRSHKSYENPPVYGTFTGDLASQKAIGSSGSGGGLKDGGMDFGKKEVKKDDKGQNVKGKEKETKVEKKVEAGTGKKEEKPETRAVSISAEVKQEPMAATESSSGKLSTSTASKPKESTSKSKSSQKKRVIQSDSENEDQSEPKTDTVQPGSSPRKTQTSSMVRADDNAALEAMLSMGTDEDDFDMDNDKEKEAKVAEELKGQGKGKIGGKGSKGGKKVKEEEEAEAEEEDGDRGKSKKRSKSPEKKVKAKEEEKDKEAAGGIRKKRKVKKTKQEIDEKGYMVTKDYYSEESYSGQSDPEPESSSSKSKSKNTKSQPRKSSLNVKQEGSRASSVATEVEEDKKPEISSKGGSFGSSNGASTGGGIGGGGGKNKPMMGKSSGGKGQSTLAGFFKKK